MASNKLAWWAFIRTTIPIRVFLRYFYRIVILEFLLTSLISNSDRRKDRRNFTPCQSLLAKPPSNSLPVDSSANGVGNPCSSPPSMNRRTAHCPKFRVIQTFLPCLLEAEHQGLSHSFLLVVLKEKNRLLPKVQHLICFIQVLNVLSNGCPSSPIELFLSIWGKEHFPSRNTSIGNCSFSFILMKNWSSLFSTK